MQDLGYSPKQLTFDEEGRKKLISGIEQISNAVKSTLGPRGKTVLIESQHHTAGITVTKDGVTVAKSIDLLDPVENLAVKMMKQAADKTAQDAGDGTTTAIVLTEALVKAFYELGNIKELNITEVLRHLENYCREILDELTTKATKLSKKKLVDVATISANNDKEIGKIIADTYNTVGKNGVVTVEKAQSSETYSEITEGFMLDRGYSSNLFINNQKKDECIHEDVHVLVSDAEISNVLNIESILKPIISQGKKLLIIAPCSTPVINTLAANVIKNGLKICVVPPPNFGWKQKELMSDIAFSLQATYFSESTGDDLSHMAFTDLGHAKKIIIGRDSSIIIKDEEVVNEADLNTRVEELWGQHDATVKKLDKEFILHRIASLRGGIGVIYVGGHTDLEQKEKFDRVDDAVCAVRSALEGGILPGGGMALYHCSKELELYPETAEQEAALEILKVALRAPVKQILVNAGSESSYENLLKKSVKANEGFDAKTMTYGDLLKIGVIDPAKVTKSALANAISVAVTILSTNAIITLARTYEAN